MENVRDEYVHRLEAMVEELQKRHGDDLYPEAAQHAEEDGSLVADADDELPRRVDAATPDGEELELELGRPIVPEKVDEEFGDYPVKVSTYPMVWGALTISVRFAEPLSDGQWEDLHDLVRSWYMTGFWGAYGGFVHRLHDLSSGGRSLKFVVDLGTAETMAVHTLLLSILGFASETGEIDRIALGEAPSLAN